MPLRRSPPQPHLPYSPAHYATPIQDSDTPSERSEYPSGSRRQSKRRRESDENLKDLKDTMTDRFLALTSSMEQRFNKIIEQNNELKSSVQFLSEKYDIILEKLKRLETEKESDKKHISLLEEKIEVLERKQRSTTLEIQNVPPFKSESVKTDNKEELLKILKSLGTTLNVEINDHDIKDIYRINMKNKSAKPIIVELTSAIKKEKIIYATKDFNKNKTKEAKLNTSHLQILGPEKPIYISEALTSKTQKIFYLARQFARDHNFSYCWTTRGKVYIRKSDGSPFHRIETEQDLSKLNNNI
ncbi:uncharacterized protein LOC121734316 [Aricia agestis]|uniref:uncharacterized protein LOC121734316 n=1 Tax=Aricia agestis TaxID=91739 RepID=UPI001C203DEA|nr:uncharacterized protein LOC121734316 [Aricia agestis]